MLIMWAIIGPMGCNLLKKKRERESQCLRLVRSTAFNGAPSSFCSIFVMTNVIRLLLTFLLKLDYHVNMSDLNGHICITWHSIPICSRNFFFLFSCLVENNLTVESRSFVASSLLMSLQIAPFRVYSQHKLWSGCNIFPWTILYWNLKVKPDKLQFGTP
jgi:hypothetical protein